MIAVLASTRQQFDLVCRQLDVNPRDRRAIVWAWSPETIAGIVPDRIIFAKPSLTEGTAFRREVYLAEALRYAALKRTPAVEIEEVWT